MIYIYNTNILLTIIYFIINIVYFKIKNLQQKRNILK